MRAMSVLGRDVGGAVGRPREASLLLPARGLMSNLTSHGIAWKAPAQGGRAYPGRATMEHAGRHRATEKIAMSRQQAERDIMTKHFLCGHSLESGCALTTSKHAHLARVGRANTSSCHGAEALAICLQFVMPLLPRRGRLGPPRANYTTQGSPGASSLPIC